MSETIISLCYVKSCIEGKSTELVRIADYEDGRFVEYHQPLNSDFYDTSRDLIYGSTSFLRCEEGSMGMFSWSTSFDGNKWMTDTSNSDVIWTEIIETGLSSPEQILAALKNGLAAPDNFGKPHDLILACKSVQSTIVGIYLHSNSFNINNHKIVLKANVSDVEIGTYTSINCIQCNHRYSHINQKRNYLANPKTWTKTGTKSVKTTDDIIDATIQAYVNKIDKEVLSRKDKQALRQLASQLSTPTFMETLRESLHCSQEEAQQKLDAFITTHSIRVDDTAAIAMMETLIANDSSYVQSLRVKVEEDWEKSNQTKIDEKEKELAVYLELQHEAEEKAEAAKQALKDIQVKQQSAEDRILTALQEVEETQKLKKDIEIEIQNRLKTVQVEKAAALAEYAFSMPMNPQTSTSSVSIDKNPGFTILPSQNITTEVVTVEDAISIVSDNWHELTENDQYAQSLTLLTFAAYGCNQPLLFAGVNAVEIADLYSASVTGKPCCKIVLSHDTDLDKLIEAINAEWHDTICFVNALEYGYNIARLIMKQFPDSRFVITANHAESLIMEPDSLYNVFLPVFTDFFCAIDHIDEYPAFDCRKELINKKYNHLSGKILKSQKQILNKWLDSTSFSPLLINHCARLQATLADLVDFSGFNDDKAPWCMLVFIIVPLFKAMKKIATIQEILSADALCDEKIKEILLGFSGIEE